MATTVVFTVFQDTGEIQRVFTRRSLGAGWAANQNLCCDTDRTRQEGSFMPIATPEVYAEMLRRAKENSYAFPAINCTSSETINAAIKGFADAGSDGIIQFSTGGAEFGSGLGVKDMVTGAVALAKFARVIANKYPIQVALHTDHCPKDKLDTYVRPLLEISARRVAAGKNPLFQSHM
jgi:fructose-bisphosphate aldolase class II